MPKSAPKNPPIEPDAAEPTNEGTWLDSVVQFEQDADWLTGADKPQLKALYSIARTLDAGTFQAALISQFTLIHRALLARRPGKDGPMSESEQVLDMFENNPGVWRA